MIRGPQTVARWAHSGGDIVGGNVRWEQKGRGEIKGLLDRVGGILIGDNPRSS